MIAATSMFAACGGGGEALPGAPVAPEPAAEADCPALGDGGEQAEGQRDRPLPYGFNSHAALAGVLGVVEEAELQARAGSALWRVAIDWRFAEPDPGRIELETHDAIYCEGLARGIRPIFHITGAPGWAAEARDCPVASCIDPPRPDALDELTSFARLVAERYPRAAAIEAWNEPNLATFWTEPDPARYVDVLAAIDDGVDSADSSLPVLGGSLSNTSGSGPDRIDFTEFLRKMYEAGAAEHIDGLAFHPYPIAPYPSARERLTETMAALRRTMRAAGEGGEPIWVTEVGLPIGAELNEGEQAEALTGIYDALAAEPDVSAVVFHTLLEGQAASGSASGFGWLVLGEDGALSPRPVYKAFEARSQ